MAGEILVAAARRASGAGAKRTASKWRSSPVRWTAAVASSAGQSWYGSSSAWRIQKSRQKAMRKAATCSVVSTAFRIGSHGVAWPPA